MTGTTSRRTFLAAAGALTAAPLLAGCGAGGAGGAAAPASGPAAPPDVNGWYAEASRKAGLRGTTLHAPFLRRPGYLAAERMLGEFTEATGITVQHDYLPYEQLYTKEVLSFRTNNDYDVVLSDCVFVGAFAQNNWVLPLERLWSDAEITDPRLEVTGPNGFFPVLLFGYGTWGETVYGLPFDCYSHLQFYNKTMLAEAGFDRPPADWLELRDVYAPKLTDPARNRYAFALQAARNETIVADALLVMVQSWGGTLLDPKTFRVRIDEPAWYEAIEFMKSMKQFMPPGSQTWDHDPTVQALAQDQTALINEWSPNYSTLSDPASSKIADRLGIGLELGRGGVRKPAFGGFSLMINAAAEVRKQKAAWLFIQWITSNAVAPRYVELGGVPGRQPIYRDPVANEKYPYFAPLVESWRITDPLHRPRIAAWQALANVLAAGASAAYTEAWPTGRAVTYMQDSITQILESNGYFSGRQPYLM